MAYAGLQVLGALIAVPFLLWDFTLKVLDNLAKLAPDKDDSGDAKSGE